MKGPNFKEWKLQKMHSLKWRLGFYFAYFREVLANRLRKIHYDYFR